ncbi:MAG: glycoside hydrolase domain-containing protein, partial [Eubacteriales bacterium]
MQYICVDPAEFLYPDITDYKSGSDEIRILTVRGSYACAQILFFGCEASSYTVRTEGWNPEVYEMVPVHVERNQGLDENNSGPHMPERIAPYDIYDCLKPSAGTVTVNENGVCAVYLSEWIAKDAETGIRHASVRIGDKSIPVTIETSPVVVPDESLTMIVGYNRANVCKYHNTEQGTEAFDALDTKYLTMLRRMRQNMLYCPKPHAIPLGDNRYDFDFSEMERFMTKAMALGYTKFTFGLGFRRSWSESTILVDGMESMSFACYCYLAQMLPAMVAFLKEHGWLDALILGIADEPNQANAMEYRALCGLVRKLAPELKLLDAMSFGPVHGAVDIWIPLNAEYQKHRSEIETFRTYGDEIWYYDCCGPRGNQTINRFMDYPLLATRYHFWASYRYNLTGYLHWAANFYMPGQDPFKQSCPEHHNADSVCYLPAGDTHIMYPGDG